MRRDYFICVFLLLTACSLAFVCLLPTCFSYDGAPAKDSPADEVSVNYPTDLDARLITLLQYAMALSCKEVDPSVNANDISNWMRGERKTGDELQMLGCYLAVMINNGRCQFSLIKKPL